ncbi:hypothetical protein AGLY_010623 [Aphis glycines]|uniref:Uncharacterized protein n=1 Tax=Aphis glycines TaxID=307491 RepID=A0A6G0TGA0_APHGL|nr:hypothetical protein AGLY_010623 [Aphis glycines]
MKYMFINSLVLRSEIKRFHVTIKWVLPHFFLHSNIVLPLGLNVLANYNCYPLNYKKINCNHGKRKYNKIVIKFVITPTTGNKLFLKHMNLKYNYIYIYKKAKALNNFLRQVISICQFNILNYFHQEIQILRNKNTVVMYPMLIQNIFSLMLTSLRTDFGEPLKFLNKIAINMPVA